MRMYLRLFWKELRFLVGPGILLIVLLFANGYFMSFLHDKFPVFYHDNITMRPQNPTFIVRFIISPIISIGSTFTLPFIYAVLFLYTLLSERLTRSRYQLYMLPIRRWHHLTAKFAALLTCIVVLIFTTSIYSLFYSLTKKNLPGVARASFEVIVLSTCSLMTFSVLLCSLVMMGYVLAVCIRRFPFLIGSATIFAGFYYMERLQAVARQLVVRHFPWQMRVSALRQVFPWFDVVFPAVAALVIIVPAILLYEKYSEV